MSPQPMPPLIRWCRVALLIGFGSQILMGHLVAFALDGPLFDWHQSRVAAALWGDSSYTGRVGEYRVWIQALLGGTMVSWAWAMLFVVAVPFARREAWAGWVILVSGLNWFLIDTSVSALHGVWVNVAFNTAVVSSIAVPLALSWRWLHGADETSTH